VARDVPGLALTVADEPDAVQADASCTRLELASNANCLSLALDAAHGRTATPIGSRRGWRCLGEGDGLADPGRRRARRRRPVLAFSLKRPSSQ
jgi:hypothetical protein